MLNAAVPPAFWVFSAAEPTAVLPPLASSVDSASNPTATFSLPVVKASPASAPIMVLLTAVRDLLYLLENQLLYCKHP